MASANFMAYGALFGVSKLSEFMGEFYRDCLKSDNKELDDRFDSFVNNFVNDNKGNPLMILSLPLVFVAHVLKNLGKDLYNAVNAEDYADRIEAGVRFARKLLIIPTILCCFASKIPFMGVFAPAVTPGVFVVMGILNAGLTYLDYKAKILRKESVDDKEEVSKLKQQRNDEIKEIFIGTIATTALFFLPAVMSKSVSGEIVNGIKAIGCAATTLSVFAALSGTISKTSKTRLGKKLGGCLDAAPTFPFCWSGLNNNRSSNAPAPAA